jgi:cytochrome c oxidase subunit 1
MPHQSIYPFVASVGALIGGMGTAYHDLLFAVIGLIVLLTGVYLWSLEGSEGYHLHIDKDGAIIGSDQH